MMRKFICLCFFAFSLPSFAQDAFFSQYYLAPIQFNPALAGTAKGCDRISLMYKTQWTRLYQNYRYAFASYEKLKDGIHGAYGISVNRNEEGNGVLTRTFLTGTYGYHMLLNRTSRLYVGFQASLFNRTIDFSKLVYRDQLDPKFGVTKPSTALPIVNSRFAPDFSTGIAYKNSFSKNQGFLIGLAVKHLTTPDESLLGFDQVNLNTTWTLHGSFSHSFQTNNEYRKLIQAISPQFIIQKQGAFEMGQLGIMAKSDFFTVSAFYRWGSHLFDLNYPDAVVFAVRIQNFKAKEYKQVKNPFEAGFAYDLTANAIGFNGLGPSYEIGFASMPNGVSCDGPGEFYKNKIRIPFVGKNRKLKTNGKSVPFQDKKTKCEDFL
jgi:type IX secretion system PorP/SprF family membrane protein